MPTINIHGAPAGKGPQRPGSPQSSMPTGPRSDIPWQRPGANTTNPAAAPGTGSGIDDYARAQQQKEAQDRRDAAVRRQRRAQEDAQWRQRDKQEADRRAAVGRATAAETRHYETTQPAAARRAREETMLGRQFEALRGRAGQPLSPSSWQSLRRQAAALGSRGAEFQARHGAPAAGLGGMGATLAGMGSYANTFATGNIMALGARGQRAAEGREWVGLTRIEHGLRRIERLNEKMLAVDSKASQEQKVNAQRNMEAVQHARMRIGAGRSGNSAMQNLAGGAIGGLGMIASNPYVDLALAAAGVTLGGPLLNAGVQNKIQAMGAPYTSLRLRTAALGRSGGFNSKNLLNQLAPPTGRTPGWMSRMGVTPESAMSILDNYGIAPRSTAEALGIVQDIRSQSLRPSMGLNDQQLAGAARLGRTVGAIRAVSMGGQTMTDDSRYFASLQKVMASATEQGLDHATSLKTVEQLLRIGAGSGAAGVNAGGLMSFWNRMTSSGLPGMRSGEGVARALGGINSAFDKIGVGGAPAQNVMTMSYFQRHGGMPKTEASLQKFLGKSDQDWAAMMKNPAQRDMLKNYLNAAKQNPAFAATYLQPFLKGHPELMRKMEKGSVFGQANPLIAPLINANLADMSYSDYEAWKTGSPLPSGPGAAVAAVPADVDAAIKAASRSSGIDVNVLRGLAMKESSMRSNLQNGNAAGLMQLMPAARADMGLSDADRFDVNKNAQAGAAYLKRMYALFPEKDPARTKHALEAYEWGPNHAKDIMAGNVPSEYAQHAQLAIKYGAQYANMPTGVFAEQANTGQANVTGGRYAYENLGKIAGEAGETFTKFSAGLSNAVTGIEHFVGALVTGASRINGLGSHSMGGSTSSSWTPRPFSVIAGPARP
jgi:hypothetical protein